MSAPAVEILRGLPGVVEVEVFVPCPKPTHRIIHLRDWHYVPPDLFALDIRQTTGQPLSAEKEGSLYLGFLIEVEQVQVEQEELLRVLVKHHGLRRVLAEGLTPKGVSNYREILASLAKTGERLAFLEGELKGVRGRDPETEKEVEKIARSHRRQLLPYGAVGRLAMKGEVEVLPLDDDVLLEKAKPIGPDGKVRADPKAVEERQDAQVKAAIASGPCSFLVLGSGHNLSASVRRVAPGNTEYIRVTTSRYKEVAGGR